MVDLAIGRQKYGNTFKSYFEAHYVIAQATMSEKISPVLSQRRYEMMVDRLQEQLQALPMLDDTRKYAQIMLARYNKLNEAEKEQLASLKEFLTVIYSVASKIQ